MPSLLLCQQLSVRGVFCSQSALSLFQLPCIMEVIPWVLPRIPLSAIPPEQIVQTDSELESTVLLVLWESLIKGQGKWKGKLTSSNKTLLGSKITTLQFPQGSFREMPTCEFYFVNQDPSAPGLLCQGQADKPTTIQSLRNSCQDFEV